jgi:DNA-directed RNA polymerase subunit alpha
LTASRGRGYSPAEQRGKLPLGEIPVDAIYSPVRKVNYTVGRARIGQQTNYDRLTLEIWTDGTMTPEFALGESAKLLVRHLVLIAGADVLPAEVSGVEVRGLPSRDWKRARTRSWPSVISVASRSTSWCSDWTPRAS